MIEGGLQDSLPLSLENLVVVSGQTWVVSFRTLLAEVDHLHIQADDAWEGAVHFPAIPLVALGRFPTGIGTIGLLVPILPLDIQNQVVRQVVYPDFSMEASVLVLVLVRVARAVRVWWSGDLQEALA